MATAKVHKREANHNTYLCSVKGDEVGSLLRRYINGEPIATTLLVPSLCSRWIATAKVHRREANHDQPAYGISTVGRGSWIAAKRVHKRKPITTTITLKPYPVSSIALQRYVKEKLIASMASGLGARVAEHGTKGAPPRSGCSRQRRFAGAFVVRDAEARETPRP